MNGCEDVGRGQGGHVAEMMKSDELLEATRLHLHALRLGVEALAREFG